MKELATNIPSLRFPEFEGEWELKKLGDIGKFSKGKGVSKSDITEDGKTECIRYGELYTHYSEVIEKIKSKTNVDKEDLVLSEANDVIIPASGETQIDIAKASCVLRSGIALGGDLNIIKTVNNGVFLSYYLNNKKKKDIANLAQGISVVHLYSSQLSLLDLNLPTLAEQQKIASFLSTVDEKLQQLQHAKAHLEQYKKGVMQQIFNQEIRFKDANGNAFPDWEEKRLGEVAIKQSSNISANKIEDNFGEYIIYGAAGVLKHVDFYEVENDYISIVKDGAGVGRILFCKGKSSVLGTMDIIKPKDGLYPYFLYCLLSNIDFAKYISGSTIPHIYFKYYASEICNIPSLPEQTKIAHFLSALDEKLNHITHQITLTQQWKKGLLQKMFV
jgi:type I restriction enzyme, S subunit